MSIDRWIDKDGVYFYNGIILSHKKRMNFAICYHRMDPEGINAKWNKSEKEDKFHLYVQSKEQKNEDREQTGGCRGWRGRGGEMGIGERRGLRGTDFWL